MKKLKFAEQKKETNLRNFIQNTSISSDHDISTYILFHKDMYITAGVYALKGYYIYGH